MKWGILATGTIAAKFADTYGIKKYLSSRRKVWKMLFAWGIINLNIYCKTVGEKVWRLLNALNVEQI